MARADNPGGSSGALQVVTAMREEVRRQAHRMADDARAAYEEVEQQWQRLQQRLQRNGDVSPVEVASLQSGYEYVRDALAA